MTYTLTEHLKHWMNHLGFEARWALRFTRHGYVEHAEPKDWLFPEGSHAATIQHHLEHNYHLREHPAYQSASAQRYAQILATLHWLDILHDPHTPITRAYDQTVSWLDVGCKDFAIAPALDCFGRKWGGYHTTSITGVEIDPYTLYTSGPCKGFSRLDVGRAYASELHQGRYLTGHVRDVRGTFQVLTTFLPFVFHQPHLAWGLPLGSFAPERFLSHCWEKLAPGGIWYGWNQGIQEFQEQQRLFAKVLPNQPVHWHGQLPETTVAWEHPRYGWWLQKPKA